MTKKSRILLVDDDPDLLKLLSIRLSVARYEVTVATSGEAALHQAGLQRPDLVISDLRMAGMDGLQLLDELRRRIPGLPILLLTGLPISLVTMEETVADTVATQRGMVGYLAKPINAKELFEQIDKALHWAGENEGIGNRAPL